MYEYSYFRVEPNGDSDKAIKTILDARAQCEKDFSKWGTLQDSLSLEKVFKCGEMPEKLLKETGKYSRSFVRAQDLIPDNIWQLSQTDWQALYVPENI